MEQQAKCSPERAKEIARRVADALVNRSDPFTYDRTYSNLINGVYSPIDFENVK